MTERKLVSKLVEVMKSVKYIQKKGFNSFNNYKYATESDVQEKIREVLAEQNVMMLPNVVEHTTREHTNRKGHTEYIATVKVEFTFHDGDTGETLVIHGVGEGQDAGDKAVYKAITGAQKYALMKAFMIPTGDDPEGDTGTDERNEGQPETASPKQIGLMKTIVKELAINGKCDESVVYESLKVKVKNNFEFTDLENLTKQQANQCIKILNAWKEEKINKKQGA
ncbi:ERF superfamily protein [Bacillus oleivorans]|uniref:ERF superfamily protein n=1 Tax=Bacillus oleivorans TaxID=1448271 RepID=A0A285CXH5_9BACI|nr:ERF family protein [Bacillus oleivorans]SNX72264.1 ERF superfamily protein [Bacillus oleivorans]